MMIDYRTVLASLTCIVLGATACGSRETAPSPEELKAGGIGAMVRVDSETGALAVDKLATKGAAAASGVQLYEQIFTIDGQTVVGQTLADSVDRLRGPVGSKVKLTVGPSEAEAREVVITRAPMPADVLDCQAGDCKNGTGTSVDRFGERYDGQFVNGRYHGQGKLVEPSGRTFEGEWVEGAAQGQGVYTSASGIKIEGEFARGYPIGTVTFTLPNGDVYVGETKDYTMHGAGKLTRAADGDVWEGTFEFSRFVSGTWLHHPEGGDGRTCTRAWANDQAAAEGRIDYPPDDKKQRVMFEGAFGDDCVANGEGLMVYKRKKMKGPFANDLPQRGAKNVR